MRSGPCLSEFLEKLNMYEYHTCLYEAEGETYDVKISQNIVTININEINVNFCYLFVYLCCLCLDPSHYIIHNIYQFIKELVIPSRTSVEFTIKYNASDDAKGGMRDFG